MGVQVYDKAVLSKIKSVFKNTLFQRREETFKTLTDKNGQVTMPLISIFRPDGWSISSSGNTWLSERTYLDDVLQVYVDLNYNIDVYANTREDLEDITAELVIYLLKNPGIKVEYQSNDGTQFVVSNVNLKYVSGPDRTSDIDDTTVGRVYRYTLVFSLSNACIYNFRPEDASDPEHVTTITQVVVEVKPEYIIKGEDNNQVTNYTHKEEYNG